MRNRKDLDGLRLQQPGDAAIYLMDAGTKRHIPDPATYNSLFRDWGGIIQTIELPDIETGYPLDHGTVLVQAHGDAAVYLLDRGMKRHIANPTTMDRYYFDWNKIQHVAPNVIAAIPVGPRIIWPE